MRNYILFLLLLSIIHVVHAQESESTNKGYFTLAAEYGYGYYWDWDNSVAEETNIRLGGQHLLSSQDKFGYSARLTLSRNSKNDKLSYGAGYYYYSAIGHYDGNYLNVNTGEVKARLMDFGVSESGHTFFMHVSPTLYRSETWRISGGISTGLTWASYESIVIPLTDSPITLKDRTAKNAGFLSGYLGVSTTASYAINPYYRVFGRVRWNFQWDTGATLLVEPTVGIELPLVRAGRRFVSRGKK
ncbi:MAG: hypothetical protein AB8F78_06390 [Saprospiraceae bacterium]